MPPPPRNYCLVDTQHGNATNMTPLQCTLHDRIWILLEQGCQRADWDEDLGSVRAHLRTSEGCVAIYSGEERDPQKTRSKPLEDKPTDPVHIEVQFGLTVWPHRHDQNALQVDDPPDLHVRRQIAESFHASPHEVSGWNDAHHRPPDFLFAHAELIGRPVQVTGKNFTRNA